MSLQGTSAIRPGTIYPSKCAGVIGNDKRILSPLKAKPLSTDATLLAGLRSGDQYAFEEMVRRFGGRLLATARRYLRSETDACDVLQDAFLCALKSMDTFKGDSQLSTWLHRIVVNSAMMHLRAKRRCVEADGGEIDALLPRFNTAGNWIDERIHSAPAHLVFEASETRALVRRCIDLLPENYRIVLILRDIEELDTEEVASLLNVTPSNVKVRLHRARQALKALLEREQISSPHKRKDPRPQRF
jgi:RNA polymerase sigma-70 factor, ECF subfamily